MRWLIGVAAALLTAAACGGEALPSGPEHHHEHEHADGQVEHARAESASFGRPGDPADAARTIAVRALDTLEFDPQRLEIANGETVTFEVTNAGSMRHEFVLRSAEFQRAHADEMRMDHGHDEGYAVDLPPGTSSELTWEFTQGGEILYACHIDNHFTGGMFGTIVVAD